MKRFWTFYYSVLGVVVGQDTMEGRAMPTRRGNIQNRLHAHCTGEFLQMFQEYILLLYNQGHCLDLFLKIVEKGSGQLCLSISLSRSFRDCLISLQALIGTDQCLTMEAPSCPSQGSGGTFRPHLTTEVQRSRTYQQACSGN